MLVHTVCLGPVVANGISRWEQQHCSQLLLQLFSSGTAVQFLILSQQSYREMSIFVQIRLISQGFWTTG